MSELTAIQEFGNAVLRLRKEYPGCYLQLLTPADDYETSFDLSFTTELSIVEKNPKIQVKI